MITQLKFSRKLSMAYELGRLFLSQLKAHGYTKDNLPEIVLPMPLHPSRLRQRGYNQAHELTKGLRYNPAISNLRLTINDQLCWRTKVTTAQSTLNKSQRQANVTSAFSISAKISRYKHVAIFDDVVTTGATVSALAYALKMKGVEQIDVWCVCRA